MHGAAFLAAALATGVVAAQAPQTADTNPSFEVASVKADKSGTNLVRIAMQPGGRLTATNVTLQQLIRYAYQVQDFQIVGGPGWLNADRFDVTAKAEGDVPPPDPGGAPGKLQLMVRSLIADRFKLTVHHDSRELPMYALVVARADGKLGPKLHPATVDCAAVMAAARGRGGAAPPPPPQSGQPMQCGMRMGFGQMSAGSMPMSQLASALSNFVQRTIEDRTKLTGTYDFDLTWTPDQLTQGQAPPGAPAPPPVDPNGPSIFTALQEQLGLKLEATRGAVDVLVIDRAEQPTPD